MSGAPPQQAPAQAAPAKVPMKVPMKAPMVPGMKVPMVGKLPPPKLPVPGATGVKLPPPGGVKLPPKLPPKLPVQTQPPAPTRTVLKTSANSRLDDDSDDDALLGGAPKPKPTPVTQAARPAAKNTPARQKKRYESPPSSSSESESESESEPESGDEEELMDLVEYAKIKGLQDMELADYEEEVKLEKPPRPPKTKFPSNIDAAIERIKSRVEKIDSNSRIKDSNKTISLGTSKTNYIDPRIVCSWANSQDVPLQRVLNRSLLDKFPWALEAKDFEFGKI